MPYPLAAARGRSVASGVLTWADYASTVFDNLLALEFRGATTLANATLYGSTPSVLQQPGGGLVFGANGLECGSATRLETGITAGNGHCMMAVFSNTSAAFKIICGSNNNAYAVSSLWSAGYVAYMSGTVSQRAPALTSGNLAVMEKQPYRNGIADGGPMTGVGTDTDTILIGGSNGGHQFDGHIQSVVIGTLKGGQSAATVAAALYTKMQISAL